MTESGIMLASCTLDELFRNAIPIKKGDDNEQHITGKLMIPDYQRAYVWQKKELKTLLADFAEYGFSKDADEKDKAKPQYYLGSIIAHKEGENLNIIDGQQRITTMAIIAAIKMESSKNQDKKVKDYPNLALEFHSPESQTNIQKNHKWIKEEQNIIKLDDIKFTKINVTLVITDSEDAAYKFFETQNTGGVRLGGADIIKAHHLREIQKSQGSDYANQAAKTWESMKHVADKYRSEPLISCLLRGRYWHTLDFKNYPHKGGTALRNAIVQELADSCGNANENIGFGRYRVKYDESLKSEEKLALAYELRQPLNGGKNTVDYFQYFDELYEQYLVVNEKRAHSTSLMNYYNFYKHVSDLDNYGYMFKCFQTALLIYLSQFGDQYLDVVAKKLFRVIFSLRLSQSRVEARSIPKLLWDDPVFDWITASYTVEQLCSRLDSFGLKPMNNGYETNQAQRFITQIRKFTNADANNENYDFGAWCKEYDNAIKALSLGGK